MMAKIKKARELQREDSSAKFWVVVHDAKEVEEDEVD
jgi:hypothetical protein